MQICPKCGILMIPIKSKKGVILACPKCGRKAKARSSKGFKIHEKVKHAPLEGIPVVEKEIAILPTVVVICPNCGNNKAEAWSQQTRSSDEPETRFFRCTKCGHTWREYS